MIAYNMLPGRGETGRGKMAWQPFWLAGSLVLALPDVVHAQMHCVEYAPIVSHYSTAHGLNPRLVTAVMKRESDCKPLEVSHVGAQGLMQLMPETARALGLKNAFDECENIEGGVIELRTCYELALEGQCNKLEAMLVCYNAGPGRMDGCSPGLWPKETQGYVPAVKRYFEEMGNGGIDSQVSMGSQPNPCGSAEPTFRVRPLIGRVSYRSEGGRPKRNNEMIIEVIFINKGETRGRGYGMFSFDDSFEVGDLSDYETKKNAGWTTVRYRSRNWEPHASSKLSVKGIPRRPGKIRFYARFVISEGKREISFPYKGPIDPTDFPAQLFEFIVKP